MSRSNCTWDCECKRCCTEVDEKEYFPDAHIRAQWLEMRYLSREAARAQQAAYGAIDLARIAIRNNAVRRTAGMRMFSPRRLFDSDDEAQDR